MADRSKLPQLQRGASETGADFKERKPLQKDTTIMMNFLLMEFLSNYLATILVAAVLLLLLFFALRSVYRNRNKDGCSGNCRGCPHAEECSKPEDQENRK